MLQLLALLLMLTFVSGGPHLEAGEKTASLERLGSPAMVLKPPKKLQGDFEVARKPPTIDFAVFPGQWEGARLWSSWGDALFASNGSFYASVGDHDTPHGSAYVYRIDPDQKRVTQVIDYNAVVGIPEDQYAPGKIHAPLIEAKDGWLYLFGYRGSVRGTTRDANFCGDWLLRHDPETQRTENLGIAIPHSSVPVLEYHAASNSLYGLAVPGRTMPKPREQFFHYDLEAGKLLFTGGPKPAMARALFLTDDGRAYYSHAESKSEPSVLVRYAPEANEIQKLSIRTPGQGPLRAASRPDQNGVAYGISRDGVVFAFDTEAEKMTALNKAFVDGPLYTATCRLGPQQRYLYYIPGAHGGTSQVGTPVIQFDVKTGKRKVLAFLNAFFRQEKNYNLGGTYGIALNEDGSQLFVNWNGSKLPPKKHEDFGLCSAMILHIPASERQAGK